MACVCHCVLSAWLAGAPQKQFMNPDISALPTTQATWLLASWPGPPLWLQGHMMLQDFVSAHAWAVVCPARWEEPLTHANLQTYFPCYVDMASLGLPCKSR